MSKVQIPVSQMDFDGPSRRSRERSPPSSARFPVTSSEKDAEAKKMHCNHHRQGGHLLEGASIEVGGGSYDSVLTVSDMSAATASVAAEHNVIHEGDHKYGNTCSVNKEGDDDVMVRISSVDTVPVYPSQHQHQHQHHALPVTTVASGGPASKNSVESSSESVAASRHVRSMSTGFTDHGSIDNDHMNMRHGAGQGLPGQPQFDTASSKARRHKKKGSSSDRLSSSTRHVRRNTDIDAATAAGDFGLNRQHSHNKTYGSLDFDKGKVWYSQSERSARSFSGLPPAPPPSHSHPGVGSAEFDPRKELQYYASHFSPSPRSSAFNSSPPSKIPLSRHSYHGEPLSASSGSGTSPMHSMRMMRRSSSGSYGENGSFCSIDPEKFALLEGSPSVSKSGHRRHMSQRRMMRLVEQQVLIENAKGEKQPVACRDAFFVLLFLAQIAAVIWTGINFGPAAMVIHANTDGNNADGEIWFNYRYILSFAAYCGVFASILSAGTLAIMMKFSENVIQSALVISIGLAFAWGTIGVGLTPQSLVPLTGILALGFFVCYTFIVWERIPFAATNLSCALIGIRENLGITAVAYSMMILAFGWSMWCIFAILGVYDYLNEEVEGGVSENYHVLFVLAFAFYWTYQVLQHIITVTVAGTIGRWWFEPESAQGCCSEAVSTSFNQSITHSFGSVCFGSLFVGFVGLMRQIVEPFRPQGEESTLLCLQECLFCFQELLVSSVDSLAKYFNQWSLIYVGIYGYSTMKAGKEATMIFEARGWTTIVSDDLLPNVLNILSIVISGCTGIFGLLLEHYLHIGEGITSFHRPMVAAFAIGLVIGFVLSNILMGTVSSALNTVLVCYAAGPAEFQKNNPDLSTKMRQSWKEVWPESMV